MEDMRETWGLSRELPWWESCLGLGTLLKLRETSLNPAEAKRDAKREG